LSYIGAHTVPNIRLVCRNWRALIEEAQDLHTTELGSAFPLSYIEWLKSQNLFISMNITGKRTNLPIEWEAEYISPRFKFTYFFNYDVSDLKDFDSLCRCGLCERNTKRKIFATFGLKVSSEHELVVGNTSKKYQNRTIMSLYSRIQGKNGLYRRFLMAK